VLPQNDGDIMSWLTGDIDNKVSSNASTCPVKLKLVTDRICLMYRNSNELRFFVKEVESWMKK